MQRDTYILCSIDPGFDGGLAFFDMNSSSGEQFVRAVHMPITKTGTERNLDIKKIRDLIDTANTVVIEKVASRPDQSAQSTFRFGEGFGMLKGIAYTLNKHVILVPPSEWTKTFAKKMNRMDKPSVAFCLKNFPKYNWTKSERSKVPHDGMTDATCIGLYAIEYLLNV